MRIRYLTSLLIMLAFAAGAQPCGNVLRGQVVGDDGKGLPGATVKVSGNLLITKDDGSFVVQGLCAGNISIIVEYIGYETRNLAFEIPHDREVLIRLRTQTQDLQGVVVEAERRQSGLSQTTSVLTKQDLQINHGRPLGESLREIPGVSAIQTGPAIFKPVIHGLHSQRILILNNGIRQEGQQWGIEHAPEVDPYIASSIEVVKGAETVRYGSDAIGGVIIVNPPALHDVHSLGGELNFGLMSNNRMVVFSGMLEGSLLKHEGWTWRMQASVKKGGDFHAAKYNLSNTGTEELNFSGGLGFTGHNRGIEIYGSSFNSNIAILRAAHTGNLQDIQTSITSDRPWFVEPFKYSIDNPRQQINHQLLKVKSYFDVKSVGRINILYGGQYNHRKEYDIRRGGRSDIPALSMGLFSNVLDASLDHEKGDHNGSIGINATIKFNSNNTTLTGITPLIPDYAQTSAGLFLLERLKRNKWNFELGGRYDFQYLQVKTFNADQELIKPNFDFNFFSGSLGLSHNFSSVWRFISNLGLSSRPPHVSELYSQGLHHGTGSIEEGLMRSNGSVATDQTLIRKELSKKWINTLQYTGKKLSLDWSVYYNRIDNYVFIRPYETRLTIRGYFPVFRFDQTDAVLMGSDFALKWEVSRRLTYTSKVSYIHAEDVKNNDKLIFIPPSLIDNSLSVRIDKVKKVDNLRVTLGAPFTMKQFRAPRFVYPEDIPSDTSDKVFDLAPAPAGFLLVNASVGFDIPLADTKISVNLSGENLLNRSYRNYMNRLRYFADDTGRNFILRLSYNFH